MSEINSEVNDETIVSSGIEESVEDTSDVFEVANLNRIVMRPLVSDTLLRAVISNPQVGKKDRVIEQFVQRFNQFGYTSAYGDLPMIIGSVSSSQFDDRLASVIDSIDDMTAEDLEKTWRELSSILSSDLIKLSDTLTVRKGSRSDSYVGIPTEIDHGWSKYQPASADLNLLVPGASRADNGILWLLAPAGGGKSTFVNKMFGKSDAGVVLRVGEPFQKKYDHEETAVQISTFHGMTLVSAFAAFVGVDHAIDGARLWYSAIKGSAAIVGVSSALPFAMTNWNNLIAHMGYGRVVVTLNPAFADDQSDGESRLSTRTDDLMRALYNAARGSSAATVRLKDFEAYMYDIRLENDERITNNGTDHSPLSENGLVNGDSVEMATGRPDGLSALADDFVKTQPDSVNESELPSQTFSASREIARLVSTDNK